MTEQREIVASEPPLDCRVGRDGKGVVDIFDLAQKAGFTVVDGVYNYERRSIFVGDTHVPTKIIRKLVTMASAALFLKRAGIITAAGELAPQYRDAPNVKVRGCALLRSPSRLPGYVSDSRLEHHAI